MSRRRLSISNHLVLMGLVTVSSALPFALAPFKAAALGTTDRGNLAYLQAALLVIVNVCILGARLSAYRHDLRGSNRFRIRKSPLLYLSLPLAAMVGLLVVALHPDTPTSVLWAIVLVVGVAPVHTLVQVELASAQLNQLSRRILLVTVIPTLADFILSSVLLLADRFTLTTVVVVTLTVEALRILVAMAGFVRDRRKLPPTAASTEVPFWRDSVRFAIPAAAPTLASNVDVILFAVFVSPSELGIYAVGKIGFSLVLVAAQSVEGSVIQAMRHGIAHPTFIRQSLMFLGLCVALAGGGAIAIWMFFPESFHGAVQSVPLLVGAGVLFSFSRWCLASYASLAKTRSAALGAVAMVVISVLCPLTLAVVNSPDAFMMAVTFVGLQALSLFVIVLAGRTSNPRAIRRDTVRANSEREPKGSRNH